MTSQSINVLAITVIAGVALMSVSSAHAQNTYAIGDITPGGGFVFYLSADGLHGLEAAPVDQSTAVEWGCYTRTVKGADGLAIGTGKSNTEEIKDRVGGCYNLTNAASVAVDYVSPSGYFDWYLPSKDELDLMRDNLHGHMPPLGGFADSIYWSSSEVNDYTDNKFVSPSTYAWAQEFFVGLDDQNPYPKNSTTLRVRAVRTLQTTDTQGTYEIQDIGPAGGFVFYVTADGLHGLEAAPVNQSSAVPWGCKQRPVEIPGADGLTLGTGESNTKDIMDPVHGCTINPIAASVAADYISPSGNSDWYLPSRDELKLMHDNLLPPEGDFANGIYWSSSEFNSYFAWALDFSDGRWITANPKDRAERVRAIRTF